jgi:hypothetical protein
MRKFLIIFILTVSLVYAGNQDTLIENSNNKLNIVPNSLAYLDHPELRIDPLHKDINYELLAYTGIATAAVVTYVHIHQTNAWWNEQSSTFKIVNDWNYALGIDKIGHFYGTNLLAHMFSGAFEAANLSSERSTWFAAIAALAFELFIEIEDGFGPQWGFSPGDAIADVLGAAYFIGQYYYPRLKNFQPRWSYFPSKKMQEGQHKGGLLIDDYEGQKYWMGVRVNSLLPKSLEKIWPDPLMLSFGMGVRDLDGAGGGQREFYIGLDFDAETIPMHGGVWGFIKNSLNYFHFPLPGVKVYPEFEFMLILF